MTKGRATRRQRAALAEQHRWGEALRSWMDDMFVPPPKPAEDEEPDPGPPRYGRDLGTYQKPVEALRDNPKASRRLRKLRP